MLHLLLQDYTDKLRTALVTIIQTCPMFYPMLIHILQNTYNLDLGFYNGGCSLTIEAYIYRWMIFGASFALIQICLTFWLLCCYPNTVSLTLTWHFRMLPSVIVFSMPDHRPHAPYVDVPVMGEKMSNYFLLWRLFIYTIVFRFTSFEYASMSIKIGVSFEKLLQIR